jgi:hypothetical protein
MGLKGTGLEPDYFNTGLFGTNEEYRILAIKYGNDLYMQIKGMGEEMLCHWELSSFPDVNSGHIGLRHMGSRSARYKDFSVSGLSGRQ